MTTIDLSDERNKYCRWRFRDHTTEFEAPAAVHPRKILCVERVDPLDKTLSRELLLSAPVEDIRLRLPGNR